MRPEGGVGLLLHSSYFCSCTCEDMCAIYEIARQTHIHQHYFPAKISIMQFVAIPCIRCNGARQLHSQLHILRSCTKQHSSIDELYRF